MTNSFDSSSFLKNLTSKPGVYQMIGDDSQVLYVGKAKNLKKRVSSYFKSNLTGKTQALMRQVVDIQVIVTRSEHEALVLENTLIKEHKPRYNILFRDDKSYPYIRATVKQDFPRLDFYRGARNLPGKYFGPFPSVTAVRATMSLLQKVFLLRSCNDTFFGNRTRPCLQYQIKRCSAPCVKYISQSDYQKDFQHALDFLEGKSDQVIEDLQQRMETASNKLEFETAGKYRDQIASLRTIQSKQYAVKGKRNIDIIAFAQLSGQLCINLLLIRNGAMLGNKVFFPKLPMDNMIEDVLETFISQYYFSGLNNIPSIIVSELKLPSATVLKFAFESAMKKKIDIKTSDKGDIGQWLKIAKASAQQALVTRISDKLHIENKINALQKVLPVDATIDRIECFDISHTAGEATVASCVVFNRQGALKSDYRRFNIEGIQANDDYAAMQQALTRRYKRMKSHEEKLPDLLLIDGGKGQLGIAEKVLEELQINDMMILGIAKGRARKPGLEKLFLSGVDQSFELPSDSQALHLLQQIRDEAHRFAITANRQRVAKKRKTSPLENVEGVGAKRRQALLKHFGGMQAVANASVDELAKVNGVSRELAKRIYDALHR